MLSFLREYQLDIMLMMSSVCGITAFFVFIASSINTRRKVSLICVELGAMLLLIFDRYAYIYRGDPSETGYWMVRISNFMVYMMTLVTVEAFNHYLMDLFRTGKEVSTIPKRLVYSNVLLTVGEILVIYSQFTGFYYTFDENNFYHRSSGFIICYIFPIIVLLLQLSVIFNYRKRVNDGIATSLFLFTTIPLLASIAQIFFYGLSLTNITLVAMGILLFVFALLDMNQTLDRAHKQEVEYLKESQESMGRLFEQTATSLSGAIDSGKTLEKGHSARVAKYSREIARLSGLNEEECRQVYFAALLHDVGKIGVPDEILHKEGELTLEEQKIFQEHAVAGERILAGITEYSYLSVGAGYHHERYDGNGYPEHLKGEEIPVIARIIAVADSYDDLTSKKKYRDPLPQSRVREEFIKESGIKYDPAFSKAVVEMIDLDPEYLLKYNGDTQESVISKELDCDAYRSSVSSGIAIGWNYTKVKFKYEPKLHGVGKFSLPSLIVYESLDSRVHTTEQAILENGYMEFGEVWFDGHTICTKARNIESRVVDNNDRSEIRLLKSLKKIQGTEYELQVGRYKDHVGIKIISGSEVVEVIAALPDNTRYTYIALTGENCHLSDIEVIDTLEAVGEKDFPRIADEISYTNRLESDLKNIQIDGTRTATTSSVPVRDGLRLFFHTISLPSAHFVWHCPYIVLFTSDDMEVNGPDYRELVLIRLDGEIEETDDNIENKMLVTKNEEFGSWDTWKTLNKRGMECKVEFTKRGNKITVTTVNAGISIKNTTILDDASKMVYVALTGDQCALTDIRIM